MFYFRVPGPEKIEVEGKSVAYGWDELHDDLCWPHEVWRSGSADALKAFDEVESKCVLAEPVPGEIIAMTDTTFEIYVNVITARDKKLADVAGYLTHAKALAVDASKCALNKERKVLQEVAAAQREQIRGDHKRAAAKWNGVLRAIKAEEPEVVVAEVVQEPGEGEEAS